MRPPYLLLVFLCRPIPTAVQLQEFCCKRHQYLDNLPSKWSLILITPNSRDFLLAVPLAFAFFLTLNP